MKANELRIGNYVNCPKDGQNPFRIDLLDFVSCGIGKFGMIYDKSVHPLTWYLQDLQPIPLTEEWLLRFGFNFDNGQYELGDIVFQLEKNEFQVVLIADDPGCAHFVKYKYKYVHQLQNLYFALTGEEFKVKYE